MHREPDSPIELRWTVFRQHPDDSPGATEWERNGVVVEPTAVLVWEGHGSVDIWDWLQELGPDVERAIERQCEAIERGRP